MAKNDLIDQLLMQNPEHGGVTSTFLLDFDGCAWYLSFWVLVYSLSLLTFKVSVELNLVKWNIHPKTFSSISFNLYLLVPVTIYLLYQGDQLKNLSKQLEKICLTQWGDKTPIPVCSSQITS